MVDSHAIQERVADLVWRTIKVRVSLLVLTIVALLAIWSALLNGDQQAKDIDKAFCEQLVTNTNGSTTAAALGKSGLTDKSPLDPAVWCAESDARNFIEAGRLTSEMFSPAFWGSEWSGDMAKIYADRQRLFSEYDTKRRGVYRLQMQLSSEYSGGSILVNALSVAEVAPFFVLIVLSVITVLGFQQACYKLQLKALLEEARNGPELPLAMARTQFFALPSPSGNSVLSKWPVLSPEKLVIWTLIAALVFSLFAVVSAFIVNVIHLTDSIFFSYSFLLFTTAFVLAWSLIVTKRYYIARMTTHPQMAQRDESPHKSLRWMEITVAAAGFASLLLPWTLTQGSIAPLRGYEFVFRQIPLSQIGLVKTYPVVPRIFLEIQSQVAVALLFLLICAVHAAVGSYVGIWRKPLRRVRVVLAAGVLFLSLNFLLYMGILEYEAVTDIAWSSFGLFSGGLTAIHGLPLSTYNPSYGFVIFLLCCFVLIWSSIRTTRASRHLT